MIQQVQRNIHLRAQRCHQQRRVSIPATAPPRRRIGRQHQIELVGGKLRDMMPWIKKNRLVDQSRN